MYFYFLPRKLIESSARFNDLDGQVDCIYAVILVLLSTVAVSASLFAVHLTDEPILLSEAEAAFYFDFRKPFASKP